MRVLISAHHHLDRNSGAPGSRINLAENLRELGHEVSLYSFDDLPASWSEQRMMVSYPWLFAAFLRRRAREFDIVDASSGDAWLWSLSRRRRQRPRLATSTQGLEHFAHRVVVDEAKAGRISLSRRYGLYHGGWRLREVEIALRRSDVAFFLNEPELAWARRRFGLEPSRSFVLPNGLPDHLVGGSPPPAEDGRPIRIAQIGTYIHGKGTRWGAAALGAVMREHRDLEVSFLGTQRSPEVVLADFDPQHHARISVIESFDHSDLPRLLEGHQIVVLPTLSEGFGKGLLEGMACGLAPVSTTTAGPREFITDHENGLLVPPANAEAIQGAIESLVADRAFLARLREAAYRTAQAYSWRTIAARKLEIYESALAA